MTRRLALRAAIATAGLAALVAAPSVVGAVTTTTWQIPGTGPVDIVVDAAGNVYTADSGSETISKITPAGVASTYASNITTPSGMAIDAAGNLYVSNGVADTITRIAPGGVATVFATNVLEPRGIAIAPDGSVRVANLGFMVGTSGVTTLTSLGALGSFAGFPGSRPIGIAVDPGGTSFIAGSADDTVMIVPAVGAPGVIATLPAGSAPLDIARDGALNLYTANSGTNSVSKVTLQGDVTNFPTQGLNPGHLVVDPAEDIYVANQGSNSVTKISRAGAVSVIATTAASPRGIATDSDWNLYVANSGGNSVTKIDLFGRAPSTPTPTAASATPALTATLLPSRTRFVSGQSMRLGIRVANGGTGAASGVTACVRLPANLVVVRRGSATQSGRRLCFGLGDVAAQTRQTRTLVVRAASARSVTRTITGSAQATGVTQVQASPRTITITPRTSRARVAG